MSTKIFLFTLITFFTTTSELFGMEQQIQKYDPSEMKTKQLLPQYYRISGELDQDALVLAKKYPRENAQDLSDALQAIRSRYPELNELHLDTDNFLLIFNTIEPVELSKPNQQNLNELGKLFSSELINISPVRPAVRCTMQKSKNTTEVINKFADLHIEAVALPKDHRGIADIKVEKRNSNLEFKLSKCNVDMATGNGEHIDYRVTFNLETRMVGEIATIVNPINMFHE